jgi:predicted Rossmann-fold nucleotide-binding protein
MNIKIAIVLCGSASGSDDTALTEAAKVASLSAKYGLIALNQPTDAFFNKLWHHG